MEKNWEIEGEIPLFLASGLCSGRHFANAQTGGQHKLEWIEEFWPVARWVLRELLNATVSPAEH